MQERCDHPYAICYASCMAFPAEDACFDCRFGSQSCLRDPFEDCLADCARPDDPTALCEGTGGAWDDSECANCCGPTMCGSEPGEFCPEPCCGPPQCVCPEDRPFWSPVFGCYAAEACYP